MKDPGCTTCEGTMQKLHQYVDRELTVQELGEVKQHLEDCPPCQRHFDFEEQLKLLVHRKACPEQAPKQLLNRILASLRQG
ncbi:MAG: hypothetical protein NVSMB17_02110 [Candidatus Dormibacteria bacterium]